MPTQAECLVPHFYQGQTNIMLDGEWQFYWNKLYQNDSSTISSDEYIVIQNPGIWNDLDFHGEKLTGKGFGTYITEIDTDQYYDSLSLYLPGFYSSQNVYLNGKCINRTGKVGMSPETSSVNWVPQVVPISLRKGKNQLVIEISNFHHYKGGFYVDIKLGKWANIDQAVKKNWLINIFTAGAFIMIGVFFLGMFIFWRQTKEYIIYTVFTISYSIRILSSGNHILKVIFDEMSWQWAVGIEYFTLYMAFWSSTALLSPYLSKLTYRVISTYFIGLTVSILILPLALYSRFLTFGITSALAIFIWFLVLLIKRRKTISIREFLSILFFLIFALAGWILEFLIHSNDLDILYVDPNLMRFLAVLVLGLVVSERYSTDYDQVQKLKEEAESSKQTIEAQLIELNGQQQLLTERNTKVETLLKEVHHRVKNNLQLIDSLLDVGALNNDKSSTSILEDSRGRIGTMSLIHQNLYMNNDLGTILLTDYIHDLTHHLADIHNIDDLSLHIDIPELVFDVDTMIPLGLIINELVTNTFKNINSLPKNCHLDIQCKTIVKGEYEISLKDQGKNLPKPLEQLVEAGYGLRLAYRLSIQLMGNLSHYHDNGNIFTLTFWDTQRRKQIL
jgi:two-component sensor histidine kinase